METLGESDMSSTDTKDLGNWALNRPHVVGAAIVLLGWLIAGHLLLIRYVLQGLDAMGQLSKLGDGGGFVLLAQLAIIVMLALYLVAYTSGMLIWKAWNGKDEKKDQWRAGWAAIVLPIAVPMLAGFLIWMGLPGEVKRFARGAFSMGDMIDIDLGFLLMIGGGVLILMTHAGKITKITPPKPPVDSKTDD